MFTYTIFPDEIVVILDGVRYALPKTHDNLHLVTQEEDVSHDVFENRTSSRNVVDDLDDDRLYWGTSERGKELYVAGIERPVSDALSKRFLSLLQAGAPVDPFIKFWVNCNWNPNYESVEQLYKFLSYNGHPFTKNGLFVGYRVVKLAPYYERVGFRDSEQVGWSYHPHFRDEMETPYIDNIRVDPDTGEIIEEQIDLTQQLRFVDRYTGEIDNSIGMTPSMDREKVEFDPTKPCGSGLHIAALSYLPSYGAGHTHITAPEGRQWTEMSAEEQYNWILSHDKDPVTENLVHPANVVSVPEHHDHAKMRTCGYYVHSLFNGPREEPYAPIDVGYATWVEKQLTEELGPKPEVGGSTNTYTIDA